MSRRLAILVAFLLGALWLPATQHCELEALGLIESHESPDDGCCVPTDGCEHDGCEIVESPTYQPSTSIAKITAPLYLPSVAELALEWLEAGVPNAPPGPIDFGDASDWVPDWSFARRAALSPRAPSLLSV